MEEKSTPYTCLAPALAANMLRIPVPQPTSRTTLPWKMCLFWMDFWLRVRTSSLSISSIPKAESKSALVFSTTEFEGPAEASVSISGSSAVQFACNIQATPWFSSKYIDIRRIFPSSLFPRVL
eukprot:26781_6